MKTFVAKNKEAAMKLAAAELNLSEEDINVLSYEEEKGLFGKIKSVKIEVYTQAMVIEFVEEYLRTILEKAGLKIIDMIPSYKEGLIGIKLSTNHNSILIGKNGRTLQALNELCRCAASNTFKKRVRVLLDINDYKTEKYNKIVAIAKREASKVAKTKITAELDPMSADERRIIHNALVNFKHVKTVSVGEGKNRHITIVYTE